MSKKITEKQLEPILVNNLYYNIKSGKWSFEEKEVNCENCLKMLEAIREQLDKNTQKVKEYISIINSLRNEIDELVRINNFY